MNEYKQMFVRWNDFSGRSNVREFWMAFLINLLVEGVLSALAQASGFFNWIAGVYGLVILIPFLALNIRRLHDTDKSGWYLLWYLLPFIGWIIVLVALAKPSK